MAGDTRNTKVVVLLIVSMTFGAALLLWLGPPAPGWVRDDTLLTAKVEGRQVAIANVTVDYIPAARPVDGSAYDCVVYDTGEYSWRKRPGSAVRIGVKSADDETFGNAQAQTLLMLLMNLHNAHDVPIARMSLAPDSDPRHNPDLPPHGRKLWDLLKRKRVVR